MHVALTGASGFIGSTLARRLSESGHTVAALVRAESKRDHIEPHVEVFVVGDQADESAWPRLLDGADAVVHNSVDWEPLHANDLSAHLASNLVGSIRLLEASAPRQFVFMSSVSVHCDMRPRWDGAVDEDHPTRPGSRYGAYKAAVEAHLWVAHFQNDRHVFALRPCAVYGIDPRLDRSIGYPIIERLRRERRFDKIGGGKFVHVEDVATAALAVLGNPGAAGKLCNLADCYARWGDLAVMAADALGIEAEIDVSSPPLPRNTFTKDAAHTLGVALDRGHEGLAAHLRELAQLMES